jgi:DNA-directed RNA polymerase subunit RPC12/RpoP
MSAPERPPAKADDSPRIEVQCLSCGRVAALDDAGLVGSPLVSVTRRLRCSECGSRAVRAARVRTPQDVARLLRSRMDRA